MRLIEDAGPRTVALPAHAEGASSAAHGSGHADASAHDTSKSLLHAAQSNKAVVAGNALRTLDAQTGDRRKTDQQVQQVSHPSSGIEMFLDGAVSVLGKAAHAAGDVAKHIGDAGHDLIEHAGKTLGPNAKGATDFGADTARAVGDIGNAVLTATGDVAAAVSNKGVVAVTADVGRTASHEIGSIAKEAAAHPHDPVGFLNWLAGTKSPSGEDITAAVPGLQKAIGNAMDSAMKDPLVSSAVGQAFGFKYVADGDYYTTTKNSLQSVLGFQDADDTVGKLMGMDIDHKTMDFTADGIAYRVEIWKGGYGNGGAFGGEIGVYTRGAHDRGVVGDILEKMNPNYFSSANGTHQVPLSQEIYNKQTQQIYFDNPGKGSDDGKHYWNLAIRTAPGIRSEDLGQRGSITMNDKASADALYKAMQDQGLDPKRDGNTISYDWK